MWLRRLIVCLLVFAAVFSLFYVAKLLRVSEQRPSLSEASKSIDDFPVENHYVIYDGVSRLYYPTQFDFRVLKSEYRGGNSWLFKTAFFVWDETDPETQVLFTDPVGENGELKKATRVVYIEVQNVTNPEEMFSECIEDEPIWCRLRPKDKDDYMTIYSRNSVRSGKMVIRIKNPNAIVFFNQQTVAFPLD